MGMSALQFSPESDRKVQEWLDFYPEPRACLLRALQLAQEEFGYLSHEVMEMVAKRLGLDAEEVINTATFYTMFNKKPVGRYHLQVCANLACFLRGSDQLLAALEQELHIRPGETTEDGLFTLTTVECLASCGTAPALLVNDEYHEEMTPDKVTSLVQRLKAGG